jgi:DivIVA domain-containing protein
MCWWPTGPRCGTCSPRAQPELGALQGLPTPVQTVINRCHKGLAVLQEPPTATIGCVGTVLIYLIVAVVVAAVVFLIASLVFGRGEELAALPPDATPTWLPDGPIAGDDVRAIRFSQVLRGYRMSEVDWTLQRTADELDALRARVAQLEAQR